jgi:hypothetical protein
VVSQLNNQRSELDAEPSCDRPPGDALHDLPFPTSKYQNKEAAAASAGFSGRTARRIDNDARLPSQKKQPRTRRTRADPLTEVWPRVLETLETPGVVAVTIFEHLQDELGRELLPDSVRRMLERRIAK